MPPRQTTTSVVRPTPDVAATPLPRIMRPQRALPADAVRPTRAEVNLANLRHNLRVVERAANGRPVWAVLKADGYGHGAKGVARTLERAGASGICVALLEEGIELREAGIRIPILVTGGYFGRAWGEVVRHDLTPVLHDPGQVEALAEEVRFSETGTVKAHVKIDTGMSRLGVNPADIERLAKTLTAHPEVRLDGLMTHFASADSDDLESMDVQLDRFDAATETLKGHGHVANVRHAANSAALLRCPRALLDLVRPGIALFGVEPREGMCKGLRSVMRLRSEIIALRDVPVGGTVGYGATWKATRPSRIATVPIGYADGLVRALSNRGNILVRGRRAPIVGAVSMDMTMIDVTDVLGATIGDECCALGPQKGPLGEDAITADELARELGTIPWEILTNVSRRVPRFYREP